MIVNKTVPSILDFYSIFAYIMYSKSCKISPFSIFSNTTRRNILHS